VDIHISDINEERLNLVEESSRADFLINSSVENLEERIKEETFGQGVDKVIVACSSGAA
jgi:threonine dehydrogenase-like Zn-dependent dehydrogenase